MEQAVEQRGGNDGIAEDFTPFGKAAVGSEDHGALFVAGVDELEEQIAAAWCDGEISALGCTHIAMEATGVYWKPVWHILSDGDFALTLANATHVKNVPGRKTDVNDATWLADLLAHGLIRGSFVPDEQTLEQRGLLRTRKQLIRERTSHVQCLQKTLEEANIKLDSVISDIVGTSGRAMIEALVSGETDRLSGPAWRTVGSEHLPQHFRKRCAAA